MVEHTHSTGGAIHSHMPDTTLPPWSVRIPAAIKKAEEHLDAGEHVSNGCKLSITTGEVALAEALWMLWGAWVDDTSFHPATTARPAPPPALVAFAEKVEKLT